ncbi:methylated-DNA--[protein]-cysteine S-methyltransferase [Glaesserella parasuis]|uniref:Methylated-DNA--protein-cysteine methyltransferase n=1 Tax=Glaesserella parasuis TaxID=738 RepID=A0AA42EIR1_GLAPU|nr:methylated-DNA--[protein]-cysteine S-methyltransferase [Glaesserella parasuis]EQA00745.1 methylated-DNA--protein-cysteine methyltransferase [Glaesserella parasuis SW114]MCT8631465.1 methylated-DNA--[protein]-cysteine S-methyltransferase [Glaesserella parasuis]MCT8643639.1 methylated-DNA--[protein]-cysteine S-methyltransferase [Glaesserella parasuis]MCT8645616.1 methylated-DNA--[protein]-cysteine S-methyltransferase [Glaesserella parasuis]MCT8647510.1 methylated-DNA--[protein]-cysteine S-met
MKFQIFYQFYDSPVGKLLLIANQTGLLGIEFEQEQQTLNFQQWKCSEQASGEIQQLFCKTVQVLNRYFSGENVAFCQLDFLNPQGTAFQQAVWKILLEIPYGKTVSYGDIAKQLNNPHAVRAVGGAVGRNPISILIPCHRVLGKTQALTGFGGGLPTKRYLLELEGISYQNKGTEFVNPKHKKWTSI